MTSIEKPITKVSIIHRPDYNSYILNFFSNNVLTYTIRLPLEEFVTFTQSLIVSYEKDIQQPFPFTNISTVYDYQSD